MYGYNFRKTSILVALSFFKSGVPVKPMNILSGKILFIVICNFPDWSCDIHLQRHIYPPFALKSLGGFFLIHQYIHHNLYHHLFVPSTKFVDKRAQHQWCCLIKLFYQISATFRPINILINTLEYLFNLLIKLISVCNDKDSGIADIFPYPFGNPYHCKAFATTLKYAR